MKPIYLDYAAATPVRPEVLTAMKPYQAQKFYNPSATYSAGRAVRRDLDNARAAVAAVLGSRPAEVFFTAGATEANNLAISGLMHTFPEGEVLISAIEHESVMAPAKLFKHKEIPVSKQGITDIEKLKKLINKKTVLVSVMLVNNELGTIQPVREIAQLVKAVREQRRLGGNNLPLYLHSDAAQAPLYLDLHNSRLGIDLLTINGGKIYGPKQTGALFIKAGTPIKPLILGGGQEYSMRSGTENVAGIIGLAKALELAQKNKTTETIRLNKLRDIFIQSLDSRASVNGSAKRQAPHILSVSFKGVDNERLMIQLDTAGVQAAVGSACSAAKTEPSHVLRAIGLNPAQARSTLRFSFGAQTTEKDIRQTLKLINAFTAV